MSTLATFIKDDASAPDIAKAPVHYPTIGLAFSNMRGRDYDDMYNYVKGMIDFSGNQLLPQFIDMYNEEINYPAGTQVLGEEFARWAIAQEPTIAFRAFVTDDPASPALIFFHVDLTKQLNAATTFSPNHSYNWTTDELKLMTELTEKFQEFCFNTMSLDLYTYLFENHHFGLLQARRF